MNNVAQTILTMTVTGLVVCFIVLLSRMKTKAKESDGLIFMYSLFVAFWFASMVIVRLLVLPRHRECCSLEILRMLTPFNAKTLLNAMDQHVPEYEILKGLASGVEPTTIFFGNCRGSVRSQAPWIQHDLGGL